MASPTHQPLWHLPLVVAAAAAARQKAVSDYCRAPPRNAASFHLPGAHFYSLLEHRWRESVSHATTNPTPIDGPESILRTWGEGGRKITVMMIITTESDKTGVHMTSDKTGVHVTSDNTGVHMTSDNTGMHVTITGHISWMYQGQWWLTLIKHTQTGKRAHTYTHAWKMTTNSLLSVTKAWVFFMIPWMRLRVVIGWSFLHRETFGGCQ